MEAIRLSDQALEQAKAAISLVDPKATGLGICFEDGVVFLSGEVQATMHISSMAQAAARALGVALKNVDVEGLETSAS